jgi:hypothetical protein
VGFSNQDDHMKSEKKGRSSKPLSAKSSKKTSAEKTVKSPTTPASREKQAKAKKSAPKIPAILLEGDTPPPSNLRGPGQRYVVGTPGPSVSADAAELPEAYGTKQLLLTARDPRWVYAYWDFTTAQLREYNAESCDKHLVLRVFRAGEKTALQEIHVHPESRSWFVPVPSAGTRYHAELGYFDKKGLWTSISKSSNTLTPPDNLSDDLSVRFATLPVDVPFPQLLRLVGAAAQSSAPLAEALQELRGQGKVALPEPKQLQAGSWTSAQEKALGAIISMDSVRRVWMGSLEITELIRRQLFQEISSAVVAQFSLPTSPGGAISSISSVSSPFGGAARGKGFWFNVNAELIIYGATEPDAAVTIGGKPIKLRSDGTFSFRFVLPDGNYDLPVTAISADGDDSRHAALHFARETKYDGEVGKHPQDPGMKPPRVEHVS